MVAAHSMEEAVGRSRPFYLRRHRQDKRHARTNILGISRQRFSFCRVTPIDAMGRGSRTGFPAGVPGGKVKAPEPLIPPPLDRCRVSLEAEPLSPGSTGAEAEWIRAAQAGDREAFARLVEHYWDRLYRWLYHLTRDRHAAEDLTQETFLKCLADPLVSAGQQLPGVGLQ